MNVTNRSNSPAGSLLGAVTEFKGGRVAELGQWLVIFRHNVPRDLLPTGTRVWRGWNAPILGASVASLDTTPQLLTVKVRDCPTADGYRVADLTVRLQVRLTPEYSGAAEELITRIRLHGHGFFDSISSDIQHRVSDHIRNRIILTRANAILDRGPMAIVFPDAPENLLDMPHVEVTGVIQIDWTEAELHKEVRHTIELEHAERSKETYLRDARERESRARAHQQMLDAEEQSRQQVIDAEHHSRTLESLMQRARTLGIDPLAIAEPDLWELVQRQNNDLVMKILETPHLHPVIRSNPALMEAVLKRLSGDMSPVPQGRQADMILDGIDPQRPLDLAGARELTTSKSLKIVHKSGLIVDQLLAESWEKAVGTPELSGAAYSVPPGSSSCMVVVVADPKPQVPSGFADILRNSLRVTGVRVEKVGVFGFQGSSIDEVLSAAVGRIAPGVGIDLTLRQSQDRREIFVRLKGPTNAVKDVYGRMTNPANPVLPTLEGLVGDGVVIRFAVPGV